MTKKRVKDTKIQKGENVEPQNRSVDVASNSELKNSSGIQKGFQCRLCEKNYCYSKSLENHRCKLRRRQPEFVDVFKCSLCSDIIQRKSNLKDHFLRHQRIKPFEVKCCSKKYYRRYLAEKHVKKCKHAEIDDHNLGEFIVYNPSQLVPSSEDYKRFFEKKSIRQNIKDTISKSDFEDYSTSFPDTDKFEPTAENMGCYRKKNQISSSQPQDADQSQLTTNSLQEQSFTTRSSNIMVVDDATFYDEKTSLDDLLNNLSEELQRGEVSH